MQAPWIVKSDDDMIVNTIALRNYLQNLESYHERMYSKQQQDIQQMKKKHPELATNIDALVDQLISEQMYTKKKENFVLPKKLDKIMCAVWYGMPVLRGKGCAKWCVSNEEWPYKSYPPYCSGSAFLVPTHQAPKLFKAYFKSRFLWVDDAYVSGVLSQTAGVKHKAIYSLYELNHFLIEKNLIRGNRLFCHHPGNATKRAKWWSIIAKKEGA